MQKIERLRRFRLAGWVASILCMVLGVGVLLAQGEPPAPATHPAGWLVSGAIGVAASLLTAVAGKAAAGVDGWLGRADNVIRNKVGPLLPVLATGVAAYLPKILPAQTIDPATIVNAPLAGLTAVVAREVWRKWLAPLGGSTSIAPAKPPSY